MTPHVSFRYRYMYPYPCCIDGKKDGLTGCEPGMVGLEVSISRWCGRSDDARGGVSQARAQMGEEVKAVTPAAPLDDTETKRDGGRRPR